jgi:hypothetical protein
MTSITLSSKAPQKCIILLVFSAHAPEIQILSRHNTERPHRKTPQSSITKIKISAWEGTRVSKERVNMDPVLALKISTFIGTGYAANVIFMPTKFLADQVGNPA